MHGRERKCVEEAPQAKKIRYFYVRTNKWCFKIAPQAKNFEYLALGIRFLLRKSSLDYVRFPKIFFPPTMGGKYPKIFSISPPRWGGNALDFPPTTLWSGGEIIPDFPPTTLQSGGGIFSKTPISPPVGGKSAALLSTKLTPWILV